MLGPLSHADILATLPHAHPIALVDRVDHLVPGRQIVAVKAISGCEPCYAGLLPRRDHAYPAALLLESFIQSAALLWLHGQPGHPGEQLLFAGLSTADITDAAQPGDLVTHTVELDQTVGRNAMFHGTSTIGGSAGRLALSVRSLVLARRG